MAQVLHARPALEHLGGLIVVLDERRNGSVRWRLLIGVRAHCRLASRADQDVAYVAPATTYRILKAAGRIERWNPKPSTKDTGFMQPEAPHAHWHVDISYLNVSGTFYYLCAVLDGFSRSIVHWEIRESKTEAAVGLVVQRAHEQHPDARPRIISDNGPQFIAKDFREFIRIIGTTHVRTSPYYPQSNGKIERWHKTMKSDAIRVRPPNSLEEARRLVEQFVAHYNGVRLHSAVGYVAPSDVLAGRAARIHAERDRKLEVARERRRQVRAEGRAKQQARIGGTPESEAA